MTRRFLVVTLVAVAGALGVAGPPAQAQTAAGSCAPTSGQYPPTATLSIQLGATSVLPGASLTVSGTCFTPNSVVALEFLPGPAVLGSAATNAVGSFSRVVTIPADATPGAHTIVATDGRFTQSATVIVLATGDGRLPRTGAAFTIPFSLAGAGLVTVGTLAVLAARRKRAAA